MEERRCNIAKSGEEDFDPIGLLSRRLHYPTHAETIGGGWRERREGASHVGYSCVEN
jgi:hypothetical protein